MFYETPRVVLNERDVEREVRLLVESAFKLANLMTAGLILRNTSISSVFSLKFYFAAVENG